MKRAPYPIPWIQSGVPLPSANLAQPPEGPMPGLLAAGGDLGVARLMEAYRGGIFPWFSEGQPILWWSPNPRMVLEVANFRLHRSLRKTLQKFMAQSQCIVKMDTAFEEVITQCAHISRRGQPGTWILPQMIEAYSALHREGFAHSVETWIDGQLVGGLYCVAIGQAVFGESMFTRQADASKLALCALVAWAKKHGISWVDCQQNTRHLASLGGHEIPRDKFLQWVARDCVKPPIPWSFEPAIWQSLWEPSGD